MALWTSPTIYGLTRYQTWKYLQLISFTWVSDPAKYKESGTASITKVVSTALLMNYVIKSQKMKQKQSRKYVLVVREPWLVNTQLMNASYDSFLQIRDSASQGRFIYAICCDPILKHTDCKNGRTRFFKALLLSALIFKPTFSSSAAMLVWYCRMSRFRNAEFVPYWGYHDGIMLRITLYHMHKVTKWL